MVDFLHPMESHIPLTKSRDQLRWRLKKNKYFDIHLFYNALRGSSYVTFSWKGIWGVKAPQMASFFVWTAT